jgi:ATP-binding cassette subfamily C protein
LNELVMVMGLYTAAAFRLMPCANRILMALTLIRQSRFGLALVAEDLREDEPFEDMSPPAAKAVSQPFASLAMQDVVFRYRPGLAPVLDGIDLRVAAGETVGFVGASGAGKSSLIDVVLGLLQPERGCVLINDKPLEQVIAAWRRRVGYVPQAIYLIDDTLRRNVAFGLTDVEIDDSKVWHALKSARLLDFVNSLPEGLDTAVGERGVKLSGGQRQRVGIARALYHQPEVLILDEATSALDNATEAEFMQAIDALHGQKTILMVAHRLSTVRNCDRIVVMAQGKVAGTGSYDELLSGNETFQQIAGLQIETKLISPGGDAK